MYFSEMGNAVEFLPILDDLKNHIIPERYPDLPKDEPGSRRSRELGMGSLIVRDEIIRLSGFPFIAYDWVLPLSAWIGQRKCFEVMAGSGALSKALQNCGVDITASATILGNRIGLMVMLRGWMLRCWTAWMPWIYTALSPTFWCFPGLIWIVRPTTC